METMNETQIETKIQEKGLNAPRLNPAHIDAQVVKADYHVFEPSKKTICLLTLRNGFTVTGEAGVVRGNRPGRGLQERPGKDLAAGRLPAQGSFVPGHHGPCGSRRRVTLPPVSVPRG